MNSMHTIQEKLLHIINKGSLKDCTLREVGALIGESSAQKIKHHLEQLSKNNFIVIDTKTKTISRASQKSADGLLVSLPIIGSANCGEATIDAVENTVGYLKVSKRLIPKIKNVFVLVADGNSMNKADINGKTIEDGDFVIVDSSQRNPESGQYVVSVIDGMANIKKFVRDRKNQRIVLESVSTQKFTPIYIHEDDSYVVSGRVVGIVKR